jgi:CubicO group peptidase (beta-lactamase class C family)
MALLQDTVDEVAGRSGFAGVVRVDRAGATELLAAYGYADRAHQIPNTEDTLFATASGTKGLTALVVMRLVEDGLLTLHTPARTLLGDDLPLVADDVTVEHLLAHRSGIGDYLDEHGLTVTDYVLSVPVHRLTTTASFLPLLDGHPTAFAADEGFSYNNGGYVLLALLAERATGESFHDLVRTRVCEPAGMVDTAFLRSDELPGRAALGYLGAEGLRTNVLHLPVVGTGDGGAYATVADFHAFWDALHAGRIVPVDQVAAMVAPRSDWPEESERFGLGFHLDETSDAVWLEGYDAGVSFLSLHQPSTSLTCTVVSNWTDGAWPVVKVLHEVLGW